VTGYACKAGASRLGQQTWGADGKRPRVAKRALGGVAGVAEACEGSRAST
jgi:hypothetical protein